MKRAYGVMLVALIITISNVCLSWGVQISDVTITEDQSVVDKFHRHTVTGITTPLPELPDVPGFIGASYVTVADIDGDEVKEIICTSGIGLDGDALTIDDGAVALFTRDGSNANNWTKSIINATFVFPNETVVRDMDGDEDLDIMVMDNFFVGWVTCGVAGIFYLENQGGDITSPSNWVKQEIYEGEINGTCPCSYFGTGTCSDGIESYHRAVFLDIDGDMLEDFVTSKVHMWKWQWTSEQYMWVEWFKKETDLITYPTGYSGPYEIGNGAGSLFNMIDVNGDDDLDVVGAQFFVQDSGGLVVKGGPDGSDPMGDTLIWFENPGTGGDVFALWNRHTIDNWYNSSNPMGKGMDVISADIDDDDEDELVFSNHNHQDYYNGNRIWPSGVYVLEMSTEPENSLSWTPITIDAGDPNLDPDDPVAVAADPYAVNRPGLPLEQGSPGMARAGNINGDSYTDVIVPGDGKGTLYYYEGEGIEGQTLKFKRASLYEDPACMPGEAEIVDLDNDSYLDIVAAIYDTSVNKDTASSSIFIFSLDNCPTVSNPGQEDVGDGDGVGDACDNCSTIDNGPNAGTCIWGEPCMSDGDCDCGSCSMAQEDTDNDGVGDVCDESPYGNLCQSYCNRCESCVEKRGAGRNMDKDACWQLTKSGSSACTSAGCYWDTGKGMCLIDICLGDSDMDGYVSGGDSSQVDRDYGARTCPSLSGSDLCEKYSAMYSTCLDLTSAGRNMDKDACWALTKSGSSACNGAGCYWHAGNGMCLIDICLGDVDLDSYVSGGDSSQIDRDYGGRPCPYNP